MKRFFVRNLLAKLFLLGLLAAPLAFYGLNEAKQLAEAGIADNKHAPDSPIGEAEMKQAQEASAKLTAMPSDLRKELLFPGGRLTNDAADPFLDLSKAVRNRAGILAAHRQFLLQYNVNSPGEATLKIDPFFAASLSKDLKQNYDARLKDRRDQIAARARLADLQSQLAKAEAKNLPEIAKEINLAIEDYAKRWPETGDIVFLREELTRRQLTFARDATDEECIRLEATWKRLMQLPSPDAIRTAQTQIDGLLQQLRKVNADAKSQKDDSKEKWATDMLKVWSSRRDFLPEALTVLESLDKALAEARVDDFFASCRKLVGTYPTDETRALVRGIAEDFCTRYLVKQPKDPVKYDEVVTVTGNDKVQREVPRRQIKLLLKNGQRRFLEDGDPLKNDGYTEFHAEKEKDTIKDFSVYDAQRKDPVPGGDLSQLDMEYLKPTPKSAAVRFYCEEYRKVDRWNAAAISEFVKKCEPHKSHLGEIYNRLSAIDKAMNSAKELFAANPK